LNNGEKEKETAISEIKSTISKEVKPLRKKNKDGKNKGGCVG
jgi:hypothetical protein